MKSTPSLTSTFATAVAKIMVSPIRTTTDPSACFANLPVSMEISFPPPKLMVWFTIFILFIFYFISFSLYKKRTITLAQ